MSSTLNGIVSSAIDSLISMVRLHIAENNNIYRFVEVSNNKRSYGFGDKSVYAYSDALNLQFIFPQIEILTDIDKVMLKLKSYQNEQTGLFYEGTHHELHTTASALASLFRWDEKTDHSCQLTLDKYDIIKTLDDVRWDIEPWRDSNIPSAIAWLAQCYYDKDKKYIFNKKLIKWLNENSCPQTGLWKKGHVTMKSIRGVFPAIASSFHFLFHFEYLNINYYRKRALYQTCLDYLEHQEIKLFSEIGFIDIDFLYCFLRSNFNNERYFSNEDYVFLQEILFQFCQMIIQSNKKQHSTDLHKILGSALVFCEFYKLDSFKHYFHISVRNALDAAAYA